MVLVQQAWLLPVSETSFPAAPRRDSCWLCTVDLQSLAHVRDASASRVLVSGRTVYRGGGDASGKRSASDGYSGWDARAGTSGSRAARFKSRDDGRPAQRPPGRAPGDVGACLGAAFGTRTLGSNLLRGAYERYAAAAVNIALASGACWTTASPDRCLAFISHAFRLAAPHSIPLLVLRS